MKHPRAALFLLFAAAPSFAALPESADLHYVEGEVLVRLHDSAPRDAMETFKARTGLVSQKQLLRGKLELLELPAFTTVTAALEIIRQRPEVKYAEPNYRRYRRASHLPNDTHFADQWGLHNTGQPNFAPEGPAGIAGGDMNLLAAWDPDGDGSFPRTGDGSVIVAVLDDAFQTNHPDLQANFVTGKCFGRTSFCVNGVAPSNSEQSHGTLVAGCIGAIGHNGIGVSGAAWNVKLMPLKFNFDVATEIQAFQHVIDHNADNGPGEPDVRIINASFGGPRFSQAELDAILELNEAGILLVTAAGNEDSNLDRSVASYPANYDVPNIVTVAATNRQDGVASFSVYGPISVDVAAPGLQIVTTAVNNGYSTNPGTTGTSFSSPYTAGVAALILMHGNPDADVRELRARLIEGADEGLEPGNPVSHMVTGGRVNAANSLDLMPQPSLVIRKVHIVNDGNQRLDPGETLTLEIELENLWADATNVTASLTSSDMVVTVNTSPLGFEAINGGAIILAPFEITVDSGLTGYRDVFFTLMLTADGGYSTTRSFSQEVALLENGAPSGATWQNTLYDEFHTWHIDIPELPEGHDALQIETTAATDIDILVRKQRPAEYMISLGAPGGFFYVEPGTAVGGSESGNETVVIPNVTPGTYYITVVNFDMARNAPYTLHAFTFERPVKSGGGGGHFGAALALVLLAAAAVRRRRTGL
jgi:hypothetical protein